MNFPIDQDEYKRSFIENEKILEQALKQAYDTRKFEIELYWKRATYFWTFIGAAFVGYAAFFNMNTATGYLASEKQYVLTLIACIGFVFSVAWHCVNKGSKFWQENWENHVELLEDKVFGPLFKTLTKRPTKSASRLSAISDFFIAPKPFSVSKINQLVSTFMAVTWGMILYKTIGPLCFDGCTVDWRRAIPVGLAVITCAGFWLMGMSHTGRHHPVAIRRETIITRERD